MMDPREFHHLADTLLSSDAGTEAANLRTAVSRAYYAAFNTGVEILNELNFNIKKNPAAHEEVRVKLNNCGDSKVVVISSQLNDLRTKRNYADYHLNRTDVETQKTVEALVKQAGNIICVLDACKIDTVRCSQMKKAIQNYEKLIPR